MAESRFSAELVNSRIFPLRLIDVRETLQSEGGVCFASAVCEWNFHVISHTWSLGIRELSKKTGRAVVTEEAGGKSYEQSFAGACFKGERSYDCLMHFLTILAADGVERVWFDALCINQMDAAEKDREIGQMGAYYGLSQGCYVVCHGIGEGFHALDLVTGDVPRWFTRVWTIQECILPCKLTFIVQQFDRSTLQALTELSAGIKSFASSRLPVRPVGNSSQVQTSEADDIITQTVASTGLSVGTYFRRRVEIPRRSAEDQDLYFVDSSDYPHLMMHQYLAWAQLQGKGYVDVHDKIRPIFLVMDRREHAAAHPGMRNEDFLGLEDWALEQNRCSAEGTSQSRIVSAMSRSLGSLDGCRWQYYNEKLSRMPILLKPLLSPETLVAQVMDRHCSVEEDRVLSILALFGIKGDLQLRTGQGLEAQLLSLVRILNSENPRLLLNLCAVDSRSNAIPYMSWVPDISHFARRTARLRFNVNLVSMLLQTVVYIRFYAANVLGMDGVGRLKLLAKACQGCLMGLASELDEYWMEVKGYAFPMQPTGNCQQTK